MISEPVPYHFLIIDCVNFEFATTTLAPFTASSCHLASFLKNGYWTLSFREACLRQLCFSIFLTPMNADMQKKSNPLIKISRGMPYCLATVAEAGIRFA